MAIARAVRGIGLVGAGLVVLACGACASASGEDHAPAIQALVTGTPAWVPGTTVDRRLWVFERTFYQQRAFVPAWIDDDRGTLRLDALLDALRGSAAHGLDPTRYGLADFEKALALARTGTGGTLFDQEVVPEFDAKLTYAWMQYAADLLGWTGDPRKIYADWVVRPDREDLAARLTAALGAGGNVATSLDALAPTHPQYKGLQAALAREREQPTGHLRQLQMNLQRWRWAPHDLGDRYVLVNVPAFRLQVMDADRPVLGMKVIVGARRHRTPFFDDEMTYLVFSPYWNIPESIIRAETLPRVAKDPGYLARNHIQILQREGGREVIVAPSSVDWSDGAVVSGLRFRQAPGDENSLGLVKFIFPNHFNVYLHDTPATALFAKADRALSHGCVRVEQPVALAQWVLQDQPEWTPERIAAAMHGETAVTVKLMRTIPVHIGYWTAWVEPDGETVTYTGDPYGIDKVQAARHQGGT